MGSILKRFFKEQNDNDCHNNEDKTGGFTLKTEKEQILDYLSSEQIVDYKVISMEILGKLSEEKIVEILLYLYQFHNSDYNKLCQSFKELEIKAGCDRLERTYFGFRKRMQEGVDLKIEEAQISLNTGDFIAFLISLYMRYSKKTAHPEIKIVYGELQETIMGKLNQNIALLRSEIESKLYLPIQRALYMFFLYEKEEALVKFKIIIQKDINTRSFGFHEIEHFVNFDRFFNRLNLEYIPQIAMPGINYKEILATEKDSISKVDLKNILDRDDFFNSHIPLFDLSPGEYISAKNDITDYDDLKDILTTVFEKEFQLNILQEINGRTINIIDVFLDNITNAYSKYDKESLVHTRGILRSYIKNKENLLSFIILFRQLKDSKLLINSTKKIQKIFSSYFGSNVSISMINKYYNYSEDILDKKFLSIKRKFIEKYF